jgi:hypothetical protein
LRNGGAVAQKYWTRWQNDRLSAGIIHRGKCVTIAVLALHIDHARLEAQVTGRLGGSIALLARKRIESDSDHSRARERLASDLDPFGCKFKLTHENAGYIASWT